MYPVFLFLVATAVMPRRACFKKGKCNLQPHPGLLILLRGVCDFCPVGILLNKLCCRSSIKLDMFLLPFNFLHCKHGYDRKNTFCQDNFFNQSVFGVMKFVFVVR